MRRITETVMKVGVFEKSESETDEDIVGESLVGPGVVERGGQVDVSVQNHQQRALKAAQIYTRDSYTYHTAAFNIISCSRLLCQLFHLRRDFIDLGQKYGSCQSFCM